MKSFLAAILLLTLSSASFAESIIEDTASFRITKIHDLEISLHLIGLSPLSKFKIKVNRRDMFLNPCTDSYKHYAVSTVGEGKNGYIVLHVGTKIVPGECNPEGLGLTMVEEGVEIDIPPANHNRVIQLYAQKDSKIEVETIK